MDPRLIEWGNEIYREDFKKVPVAERAVFLPHCLIHQKCPAKFSKEDGILCIKCHRCRCGEIRDLAEAYGYQFYITPSVGFTKRLAQRKHVRAAIGTTCLFEIERGLRTEKIASHGVVLKSEAVIPQITLTRDYNCIDNDTDWERIMRLITALTP